MNKIKFFVGAIAALAIFAVASTASAAYMQTSTLKLGSKGTQVMVLQQTLNMSSCKVALSGAGSVGHETTTFGPATKAAVKCFQAANGLTADGVVGPMTGAAIGGVTVTTTTTTTGTTTTTTGTTVALCPNGMTLASNCMTAPSAGTSVSGAPLSINNVSAVSGYINTTVGVGVADKPVADIRLITGAGGSGSLTGLNVSFYNYGSGDYQFIKYAQNVSVWLNGVKVGTLDAAQFSQYNSVYSAFIPVSNAMLSANSTNDVKISVSALPVIDSNNYASDIWTLDVTSIRYTDSTGTFNYTPSNVFGNTTYLSGTGTPTNSNSYFSFASAASAQSIKLTVTKNIGDSVDRIVSGSASASTQGVTLAMIDLNAQGSAISLRRLPVTITVGGGTTSPTALVNTLRLYDAAGNQIDSESVPTGSGAQTVTFQNLTQTIPVDGTVTYTVKGDFNTVDGSVFPAGAYAMVGLTSGNTAAIQAYDSGNNVLSGTTYLTGTTTGNRVYMYVNGISVGTGLTAASATAAAPGGSNTHSVVSFSIPFSVTSFGTTAYIPSAAVAATTATAAANIQFCVDNASGACQAVGTGVITYAGTDNLVVDANGNFQIPVGQTKNFNLQVTYAANGAASYRASLLNVNWNTTDSTSVFSTFTAGLSSNQFKTPYVAAQ